MSDYVPTVGELLQAYVEASGASMAQESYYAEQVAEFERGIARVEAEALREVLLSDEAVERAARGMFAWDTAEHPFSRPTWEGLSETKRDVWRSGARATLAAALGEDEDDE